jgi:N-hydroxyarylamine O-acetyltransferase
MNDFGPSRPTADAHRFGHAQATAYLERIGVPDAAALAAGPHRADADLLRDLHRRHLLTVPFENLSIHLGEEISLTTDALYDKLITARRGGFCYELNGAFAALLTSLGYRVTLLAARVFGGDQRLGPPFDHLALRVETGPPAAPESWLADVGFGRHITFPLRFDERGDQPDPGGVFRLAETPDGDLDVHHDGAPQYRLELRPRSLSDFEMACWWQRTSPRSHFTQSLVCSLLTETGRITLSGNTLVTTTAPSAADTASNPTRREIQLPNSELLSAYREHFGITLKHAPTLKRA